MKKIAYCLIIIGLFNGECTQPFKETSSRKKATIGDTIVFAKHSQPNNPCHQDTSKISKLPFGNSVMFDLLKTNNHFLLRSQVKRLASGDSFLVACPDSVFNFFPKQYSFDFDYPFSKLTTQNTDDEYVGSSSYGYLTRLPNKDSFIVVLVASKENKSFFDASENVELLVVTKQGKLLSSQNIAHSSGYSYNFYDSINPQNESYGQKYFFIDSAYVIHVKYFLTGDAGCYPLGYLQYIINAKGKIVRWFDGDSFYYRSALERGIVKGHQKDGEWIEYYGGGDGQWVKAIYKMGIPTGVWQFYKMANGKETNSLLYEYNIDNYTLINSNE